jgi:hypothetical protein
MGASGDKNALKFSLVGLHILVIGLAVFAWAASYRWQLSTSLYYIFPLLGLLAFSFMWLHYVTAALNRLSGNALDTKNYYEITEGVVLALILLHPGLFIFQLWSDDLGLPPGSYSDYVGTNNKIFVTIAILALAIFLLYEFKEKLKKTRFWPYMVWLNNFAVVYIFVHAWQLGGVIRLDWFRTVWVIYFIIFLLCLAQKYTSRKPNQLMGS